jgi:hypothetical protein
MWPPIFDPLTNITTPPKPILGVTQARIVTNHEELSEEDDDSFERKHSLWMPRIVPIKKSYNERKGKPSLIRNGVGHPTNGGNVPISNNVGPFGIGSNGLPRSGGSGPRGGGDNNPPKGVSRRPL